MAAASLILDKGAEQEELQEIPEDIRRDNLRASNVILQLRRLFDKHEVERQLIDLGDALLDMQTVLRAEAMRRWVELTTAVRGPRAAVLGDRVQIQQVLINLVLNAMDAVAGQPDGRRKVTVTLSSTKESASIEVADTGHGIDGDHFAKLFDSFFSTKTSGIGLGLSIVRTLVEAHGGTVRAENRSTGGAVFCVKLPIAAHPLKLEVAPRGILGKGRQVLPGGIHENSSSLVQRLVVGCGEPLSRGGSGAGIVQHLRDHGSVAGRERALPATKTSDSPERRENRPA